MKNKKEDNSYGTEAHKHHLSKVCLFCHISTVRKGSGRKLFIIVKISYLDLCITQLMVKVQCRVRIRDLVKCRLSGHSS